MIPQDHFRDGLVMSLDSWDQDNQDITWVRKVVGGRKGGRKGVTSSGSLSTNRNLDSERKKSGQHFSIWYCSLFTFIFLIYVGFSISP